MVNKIHCHHNCVKQPVTCHSMTESRASRPKGFKHPRAGDWQRQKDVCWGRRPTPAQMQSLSIKRCEAGTSPKDRKVQPAGPYLKGDRPSAKIIRAVLGWHIRTVFYILGSRAGLRELCRQRPWHIRGEGTWNRGLRGLRCYCWSWRGLRGYRGLRFGAGLSWESSFCPVVAEAFGRAASLRRCVRRSTSLTKANVVDPHAGDTRGEKARRRLDELAGALEEKT